VRFPGGVDWGGEQVTVCVGIAAKNDGHVQLLAALADILLDPDRARTLREATEVNQVMKELT
jgi:PTS system mannitol-specific IIA component